MECVMNKSEFIDLVAERAKMTKKAAADVVEAIFDTTSGAIASAMGSHGRLSIPGFGRFATRKRAARKGRNPRTGATVDIPERTTLAFTPGKRIKETVGGAAEPARVGKKAAASTKSGTKAAGRTKASTTKTSKSAK
ncbi:hypothetical protein BH24GEM2_BH24GEM2_07470 [soil metagenome]|jgi:DNA-binding protein HU-beta